ncbi:MAG TPA: hypothetical protein PKI03_16375 [Pseudomonadota bacterium]|nr:hypothetical protein [Pseudomonadota bacterium]
MSTPTQTPSLCPRQPSLLRLHGSLPRLLGWGGLALVLALGASSAEARTHRRDKKPGDAAVPAAADAGKPAGKEPAPDPNKDPSKDPAPAAVGTADAAGKPAAPAPGAAAAPAGKPSPAPATTAKPGATTAAPAGKPAPAATATPAGKPAPAAAEPAKPASAEAATAPPKELQVSEPRQQAAREHFMRGVDLYSQANYPNAWLEFSAAYQIVPLIDLLNNMARCEVRMGRPRDALDHFKRFIAARPNDQDAEYINQEIARLEGELGRRASSGPAPDQTEAPASKPPPRIPTYSIFAGAATVAAAIAGGVTLGLVNSRYGDLKAICATVGCPAEDVGVLERQSFAGYGLLGAAGVGAAVTGILLFIELRGNKEAGLRQFSTLRIGAPLASFALPGRF